MKKRFWHRLDAFINDHEFEGREQFELSEAVIVQISATAIHLTLGLNDFLLDHFKKILVYPDIYYSPFTKTHNKGETNPHGIITLSWPHAKEGIDNSSDSINLCYHEFAHALMLQYVNTGVNDLMFQIGYEYFSYLLQHHQLSQYTQSTDILCDYAFANKMEFWAVSVESFLENPSRMQVKCYPLYDLLCKMLRQDPVKNRYGFLSSFPIMDDV